MNENIDLTKILKNCPIGWKFYSSVYGEVEFLGILYDYVSLNELGNTRNFPNIQKQRYPIQLMTDSGEYCISRRGRYRYGVGECILFPSKDQRDWSKFTAPWYKKERFDPNTLKPFDRVIVRNHNGEWKCATFSHIKDYDSSYRYDCCYMIYRYCIPYNDDTRHLVGTTEEAPEYYRYWED